ncbi:MalY/PatB family protein [Fusobacterium sp. PH5-44]|uniref:MalY/PatB family protein n=1 Tax=unclassified Fusobacterium TaxID=2648384 RepID=UPI003D21BA67
MKYNFDTIIDRKNTASIKTDILPEGASLDSLPLWVADMDFQCAEPILEALHDRVNRQIFGYTNYNNDTCKSAITGWFKRRFDWTVEKEDIFFSPGIVPAIAFLVNVLSEEGDGIIIQRPVYYPFTNKIEANGREVINNPLLYKDGKYEIDFENLEEKLKEPKNKGLIFCSPHNPVGRVWKEDELLKLVALCQKYNKWIISDEIHGDLTRKGIVHIPLTKIAPHYKDQIIVCTAPSKTFNLAGMQLSNIIITNKDYQKKWLDFIDAKMSLSICNPFGLTAVIAAYNDGEEWLEQIKDYLDSNINYIKSFIEEHFPKAKVIDTEGTYLMWIDFNEYCNDSQKLEHWMQKKAKVALDEGYIFGSEGSGFERINVASPRSILEECMKRIKENINSLIE